MPLTPSEDFERKLAAFNRLAQLEATHGHARAVRLLAHQDFILAREIRLRATQAQQRPR